MTNRTWRKSSYSTAQGNCVEVCADDAGIVAVRDSKDVAGLELTVSNQGWAAFVEAVKHGEFELS